jgi:hypothetical protein
MYSNPSSFSTLNMTPKRKNAVQLLTERHLENKANFQANPEIQAGFSAPAFAVLTLISAWL